MRAVVRVIQGNPLLMRHRAGPCRRRRRERSCRSARIDVRSSWTSASPRRRRAEHGRLLGATSRAHLLKEEELRAIEGTYAEGITAVQIVDVFTSRGIKFSEASFRKYVQQGLLPRSKRVGRKGKHRGSLGVYPAKTIRRINSVKQLMADGYTIEEIQGSSCSTRISSRAWPRISPSCGRGSPPTSASSSPRSARASSASWPTRAATAIASSSGSAS